MEGAVRIEADAGGQQVALACGRIPLIGSTGGRRTAREDERGEGGYEGVSPENRMGGHAES